MCFLEQVQSICLVVLEKIEKWKLKPAKFLGVVLLCFFVLISYNFTFTASLKSCCDIRSYLFYILLYQWLAYCPGAYFSCCSWKSLHLYPFIPAHMCELIGAVGCSELTLQEIAKWTKNPCESWIARVEGSFCSVLGFFSKNTCFWLQPPLLHYHVLILTLESSKFLLE